MVPLLTVICIFFLRHGKLKKEGLICIDFFVYARLLNRSKPTKAMAIMMAIVEPMIKVAIELFTVSRFTGAFVADGAGAAFTPTAVLSCDEKYDSLPVNEA